MSDTKRYEEHPMPVGTREQLIAVGVDPTDWRVCGPDGTTDPATGDKQLGCPWATECKLPHKFKGVKNHLVYQKIKGFPARESIVPCYAVVSTIMPRVENQSKTGDKIAVIADEDDGVEYEERKLLSKKDNNLTKNMVLDESVKMVAMPKFPLPGEKGSVVQVYDTERESIVDRMQAAQARKAMMAVLEEDAPIKRGPGRPRKEEKD